MWGFQMQKIFTWGGGLQCKGGNFPPLRSNAEIQQPHFPQADGLIPSPDPIPQPTHVIRTGRQHLHIDKLIIFLVQYTKL